MQLLKKAFANGLIVLGLSFSISVAASNFNPELYERLEKIARQGSAEDQSGIGSIYNLKKIYSRAFYWNQQAANQGNVSGQYSVRYAYLEGQGVRQDYKKALYWLQQAADQNSNGAQLTIGVMYSNGQGVRQSKTQAKEWYGKSCDNGSQSGCKLYRELNEQGY